MDIATLRDFFMWCAIINGGLLVVSFLICGFAGDWVYKMHTRWFKIPRQSFNTVIYCFLGFMKICVIMFNLIPYIALVIIS